MQQRLGIRQAQRFQFISKSTEVDCPQGRFARFLRGGTTLGAFVFERVSDLGYAGSGHAASPHRRNRRDADRLPRNRAGPGWAGLQIEVFFSGLPHLLLVAGTLEGRRDIQDKAKGTRSNKSENSDGWHDLNSPN